MLVLTLKEWYVDLWASHPWITAYLTGQWILTAAFLIAVCVSPSWRKVAVLLMRIPTFLRVLKLTLEWWYLGNDDETAAATRQERAAELSQKMTEGRELITQGGAQREEEKGFPSRGGVVFRKKEGKGHTRESPGAEPTQEAEQEPWVTLHEPGTLRSGRVRTPANYRATR